MVETWRTGDRSDVAIRTDRGGRSGVSGVAGTRGATEKPRDRIPTMRMLASLLVDGILRIPAGYRRGMFLDMYV
jgi:hypothetical protein